MTGALIFAFNNEQIDYLAMARWSAKNIFRHLGIPTAIVTNKKQTPLDHERFILIDPAETSGRYFSDYADTLTWYNGDRINAYELSPWQKTLVLDADYVVASNQMQSILASNEDFLAYKTAYDITGVYDFKLLNSFGDYNMPMYWATVMMFTRNVYAQQIFEMMTMIKHNWDHYRSIYKFANATYRNDYALSIALNTLNGHTQQIKSIPWAMPSLTLEHKLSKVDTDVYRVDYMKNSTSRYVTINTDFHAMCKQQLGGVIEY
jgi:hypothetical protein